jgi:DNA-binding NarL/FixJ family response regulator
MPEMDGLGLAAIRARAPEARVVMVTTIPGDTQMLRALKLSACGYICDTHAALRPEKLPAGAA